MSGKRTPSVFPRRGHDHDHCVAEALAAGVDDDAAVDDGGPRDDHRVRVGDGAVALVGAQIGHRRTELSAPDDGAAVVADVTGDGKNDLIVLVHDRVIVYPQE